MTSAIACDVVVLGAGAAGLMCALHAGRRGRRVVVVEHNAEAGRKVLISGGGRCNFTNRHTSAENFLSENPHFARSALARFTPADFIHMVERHGIRYHEKTLGQLFCDGSARQIVDMLLTECAAAGVLVETGCEVREARRGAEWQVETAGATYTAQSVVLATGGLSIPKLGATPLGYRLAAQFGLRVVPTRAALVPVALAADEQQRWCDLAGVSAEVVASAGGRAFREQMLITHRGLSGPAVLQASSYWRPGEPLEIDLLPGIDFVAALRERKARSDRGEVKTVLAELLPRRLAERWVAWRGVSTRLAAIGDREMARLDRELHSLTFRPSGTEGYAKAEVTAGGIDTRDLSSQTMEARTVPGFFAIGEVVDVTGQLGGFNFQWAWASGYAAGLAV